MTSLILKSMLQELIPYIEGRYVLGDGGLLGLVRDKKLIEHDNDLDLFLFPGTIINLPESHPNLGMCEYYMDSKIYRKNHPKFKTNPWLEYLSYIRCLPETRGFNRSQLFKFAKSKYYIEKIAPEFSLPYIDIYKLKDEADIYTVPFWYDISNIHYKLEELQDLQTNTDLGFNVTIPNHAENILERQYGKDWRIPNKDFQY